MESLQNKTCLVTGATRGIGRAIAKMLAEEGARVTICGRKQPSVDIAAAELSAETGNKVKGKAADLSKHAEVVELFRFTAAELGPLDILVNNAGIGIFGAVGELSVENWKRTIETNLYGTFYCLQQALSGFETLGGGHVINIGSLAGAHAFAGGAAYNASKFGLTGFTEAVMQDLRRKNVRVSYVMPGSVATEFGSGTADGHAVSGADWKVWPVDIAEAVKMMLQMPPRTLVSRIEIRPSLPKS
ncbi:MAG: SDR family oxidoreductase [Acidobacteriota bacterium]